MKKYSIKKGTHSAQGFNFGLTFKKSLKFQVKLTNSCLYSFGDQDDYDINKLFGFSTALHHHQQSARIGWRCKGDKFEILSYPYDAGKRLLSDSKILGVVSPNELFECSIKKLGSSFEFSFRSMDNDVSSSLTVKKQKTGFPFSYYLFPYFGGNKVAPQDMDVFVKVL